jgi:carboxyl-terminal processing protease
LNENTNETPEAKKPQKRIRRTAFDRPVRLKGAILACVICVVAASVVTALIIFGKVGGLKNFKSARAYLEVQNAITDNYIGDSNVQSMKDAAAAAMVSSLGDKWSYYMTADEYKTYKLSSSNKYEGIGVTIAKDDKTGGFAITTVIAGSPAETAGLKKGMTIMTVDGKDVTGLSTDGIRDIIQAKVNSTLTLGISEDGGKPTDYSVDCSVVYNNPVSYELKDGSVGYIKISNFDAGSGDAAKKAIDELLSQGAKSMVFDVRDNPGGMLSELIKVLDYILPEGDLFVSVDHSGSETVTKSDNVCLQMKMTVLVNKNTYSAAEYFAAALQEYNWATVVGEATTGKGRSQTTIEMSDGSAVHISSRTYLTPKRVDLSEKGGITPDVVLENADPEIDDQLTKAIDIAKGS